MPVSSIAALRRICLAVFADLTIMSDRLSPLERQFLLSFSNLMLDRDPVISTALSIARRKINGQHHSDFLVVVSKLSELTRLMQSSVERTCIVAAANLFNPITSGTQQIVATAKHVVLMLTIGGEQFAFLAHMPSPDYVSKLGVTTPAVDQFNLAETILTHFDAGKPPATFELGEFERFPRSVRWIDKLPRRGFYAAESTGDYRYAWSRPSEMAGIILWGDGRVIKEIRICIGSASSPRAFSEASVAMNGIFENRPNIEAWGTNAGRISVVNRDSFERGCISLAAGEHLEIGGRMLGMCVDKIELIYE